MSAAQTTQLHATLAVRIIAFIWMLAGLFFLCANVLETYTAFNPTYWLHYISTTGLRPGLATILGLLLRANSKRLGKCLVKGLANG